MSLPGALYLLPNLLNGTDTSIIAPSVQALLPKIGGYIVEDLRNARRYLLQLGLREAGITIDSLIWIELDKHHPASQNFSGCWELSQQKGINWGLLSEAGSPAIADPGSVVVRSAHKAGIVVKPQPSPSSLLMALMASGCNGQQFAFLGYLPIQAGAKTAALKKAGQNAANLGQSQIIIETPYRNDALLTEMIATLHPERWLCVAADLTLPTEQIWAQSVATWRSLPTLPKLNKRPAVFIIG